MIWIYCTRLVEHGLTDRFPSLRLAGITRVECELVEYALRLKEQGAPIKFCAFNYFNFKEVPEAYLRASIQYLKSAQYRYRTLVEKVHYRLIREFNQWIRQPLHYILKHPFSAGDTIISVSFPNIMANIREIELIKKKININYLFYCHDIIPITHPQYSDKELDFKNFFDKNFEVSDIIYFNSLFTQKEVCQYLGKNISGKTLGISYPGCEIIPTEKNPKLSEQIQNLLPEKYILYVSTIQIRKNHQVIYEAYKKLLLQDVKDLPKIIFVGRKGWKVDELLAQLETDPEIQGKIIMLNHVSDTELHELYQHCLFTVFPSLMEGYGSAVAESLAFGKYCLASATAGPFQEIGGDLIDYLDPNDVDAWAEQMAFLFSHPEVLAGKEKNIREKHKNITWEQFAKNLLDPLLVEDKEPE